MKSKFEIPKDLPAAACGRCVWWLQTDAEGWGDCLVVNDKRWYQCMICNEYDQDPHPGK